MLQARSRHAPPLTRKLWAFWLILVFIIPDLRLVAYLQGKPGEDIEYYFADAPRYLAYAQAALGRPYDAYYIRPLEGWKVDAAAPHRLQAPSRPLTPARDFSVEYPPGAWLAFLPPALVTDRIDVYYALFSLEMGLALTLAAALSVKAAERLRPGAGPEALMVGMVFAGPGLICGKFDALVALSLALFAYAVAAGRPYVAACGLVLGGLVKGAPILLVPIAIAHFLERGPKLRVAKAAALSALALGGAVGLYYAFAGPRAFDMIAYHAARPLQIETAYAAAALILQALGVAHLGVTFGFGSWNVVATFEPALRTLASAATAVMVGAALVWRLMVWRRGADETASAHRTLAAALAIVVAPMALGKFFSPQYIVWLLGLVAAPAAAGDKRARNALLAAALATQIEFPFAYHQPLTLMAVLSLARVALLLVAAGLLIKRAAPPPRDAALRTPAEAAPVP